MSEIINSVLHFVFYNTVDVNLWNKNMGQKWRKIRRRCSSFNTGTGKGKTTTDDRGRCDFGTGQDRGLLIPTSPLSDDSSVSLSSPPRPPMAASVTAAATTMHDMLRARLNMLNIGNRRRPQLQHQPQHRTTAATDTATFYVPSPLLRTADDDDDDDDADEVVSTGPCSLPVVFDLASDHRLQQPSSLCRVAETPSSCGSSGRGTADDGAGSDRSSVSYSDHGYNSIVSTSTANGYDADR